jgi:hypothetical protein
MRRNRSGASALAAGGKDDAARQDEGDLRQACGQVVPAVA